VLKDAGEAHVEAALQELEDALGHAFAAPSLLVCALTHRSLAREQAAEQAAHDHRREGLSDEATVDLLAEAQSQLPCDNERLEFWAMRFWGWWLPSRCLRSIPIGTKAS